MDEIRVVVQTYGFIFIVGKGKAYNVREWNASGPLTYLENGPDKSTILIPYSGFKFNESQVLHSFTVNPSAWTDYF